MQLSHVKQKYFPIENVLYLQVGSGDPHSVVFHFPGVTSNIHFGESKGIRDKMETGSNVVACLSEELLVVLMKSLRKYLVDDSVKIIDMASQTLRVFS